MVIHDMFHGLRLTWETGFSMIIYFSNSLLTVKLVSKRVCHYHMFKSLVGLINNLEMKGWDYLMRNIKVLTLQLSLECPWMKTWLCCMSLECACLSFCQLMSLGFYSQDFSSFFFSLCFFIFLIFSCNQKKMSINISKYQ